MTQAREPRTLLEALVRQQQLTWKEAARKVSDASADHEGRAAITLTDRHLARLAKRERGGSPNPATCRALQYAFGHPVVELLGPYRFAGDLIVASSAMPDATSANPHREVLTMAADRAQKFALNLPGMADITMEQVIEGVRDLALAYPTRPLSEVLGHLVSVQETIFSLLEQPQRPNHGGQLYFLAGVVGGMLAKASHDLADPSAALTQSRTAYLCAEQADHNGLRAWISGLQSLISYWAARPHEAIRYAQRGGEFARRAHSTASVWLAANEARAWGRLGNENEAKAAIQRAEDSWSGVQPDDLDELGGIATFSRSRHLYYAAEALAWLPAQASLAEDYSVQAVAAYADTAAPDWAFGDQAGSHSDLAIARIALDELEGAAEAILPVLQLPPDQRIGGIIKSAQHVQATLIRSPIAEESRELQEQIEAFTHTPVRAIAQ